MKKQGAPLKTGFFYGWVIVLIAGFTLFFSGPGQTYSVSVFIDSYIDTYGWSRSAVSSMYSLGTLSAGMLMGFVGRAYDRYGHRKVTVTVAVLMGFALIWMSMVNSIPMLFVGFFLIRLLGQGSMSLSGSTLVPQWFVRRRGLAMSLMSMGGALSLATLPPFNNWMIQRFGWQMGWRTWSVLMWVVFAPLAYLLIRDRPEAVGLHPDNVEVGKTVDGVEAVEEEAWTLMEALRTRCFWILIYIQMVPSAIITGLIFHQMSILTMRGLTTDSAALISSLMSVVRLPMILVAGRIVDNVKTKWLLATSMTLLTLSMVSLYLADSRSLIMVYGVLVGLQMGLQSIVTGVVWPEYYGRRNLSTIKGVTMMGGVIGSALGPLPFGFAYDLFGGYNEALLVSMVFPLAGVLLGMFASKPEKCNLKNRA